MNLEGYEGDRNSDANVSLPENKLFDGLDFKSPIRTSTDTNSVVQTDDRGSYIVADNPFASIGNTLREIGQNQYDTFVAPFVPPENAEIDDVSNSSEAVTSTATLVDSAKQSLAGVANSIPEAVPRVTEGLADIAKVGASSVLNSRDVLGNIMGTGLTGKVQAANVAMPVVAASATAPIVVGGARVVAAATPFILEAGAAVPILGQAALGAYAVGTLGNELIYKPISNAMIENDSKSMREAADQRLREQYRDRPEIAEAVINQRPGEGVPVRVGGVIATKLVDTATRTSESSALAMNNYLRESMTNSAIVGAAREGIDSSLSTLATSVSTDGDIWPGNRNSVNLDEYLKDFDPLKLTLNFGNSNLDLYGTKPTQVEDSKNGKKPEDDGKPPSIVDTTFGNGKRQTDFGKVLGASVGLGGDIGDSKPQFPVGVDPEKKIQIGDPKEDRLTGDPRPEKLHPTFLPALPDVQKVIVSKMNGEHTTLLSNLDLKELSGTLHDRPPAEQGDPMSEVTPLAELLKKNSTFGDPSVRPEGIDFWRSEGFRMSDGDLSNSDQIRKANEQLESLRRAFNQSNLERTFNKVHSTDEYRNLLESLGGAVVSVEKPTPLDELTFRNIPKAALGAADEGDKQGSGDDALDAGKDYYGRNDVKSYSVERTFFGLGPNKYTYYDEHGNPLGDLSEANVREFSSQRASDTVTDRGRDSDTSRNDSGERIYGPGQSLGRIPLDKNTSAEVVHESNSSGGRLVVTTDDGRQVAYAEYGDSDDDNPIYLSRLFTDKDFRGSGVGTQLLLLLQEHARESGKSIELYAAPHDDGMSQAELENYYRKLGFREGDLGQFVWP